ncbi:nuclease-like isoform X1 [Oculina patagonica]
MKYICQPGNQQTYYATMFDERLGIAVYSAYKLTQEKVNFLKGRPTKSWKQTPGIKNQGNGGIYYKSGFDKGHLFACKTASFKLESSISTFTYTNAVPQRPGFNRGSWKAFERKIRQFGKICTGPLLKGVLYLITGVSFVDIQGDPPQANPGPIKLLFTRIAIPNSMWTAGMCVSQDGSAQSFAVIGNDVQIKKEMHTQQVTVAQLEAFLQIDVGAHSLKTSQVQTVQPTVKLFPGIAKSVDAKLPK